MPASIPKNLFPSLGTPAYVSLIFCFPYNKYYFEYFTPSPSLVLFKCLIFALIIPYLPATFAHIRTAFNEDKALYLAFAINDASA